MLAVKVTFSSESRSNSGTALIWGEIPVGFHEKEVLAGFCEYGQLTLLGCHYTPMAHSTLEQHGDLRLGEVSFEYACFGSSTLSPDERAIRGVQFCIPEGAALFTLDTPTREECLFQAETDAGVIGIWTSGVPGRESDAVVEMDVSQNPVDLDVALDLIERMATFLAMVTGRVPMVDHVRVFTWEHTQVPRQLRPYPRERFDEMWMQDDGVWVHTPEDGVSNIGNWLGTNEWSAPWWARGNCAPFLREEIDFPDLMRKWFKISSTDRLRSSDRMFYLSVGNVGGIYLEDTFVTATKMFEYAIHEKFALSKELCRRRSLVEEAFSKDLRCQFERVVKFCRVARNHMVHGPDTEGAERLELTNGHFVRFLFRTLIFTYGASRLAECGVDPRTWSTARELRFHPFAEYVQSFKMISESFLKTGYLN